MTFAEDNHILIGLLYVLLSIFILPIYIVILIIFFKYPEYRNSAAYKIMISIGINECLQLIAHIYSGIANLTGNNFGDEFEQFMGGFINSVWLAVVPQNLVLALNRLDVFRNKKAKWHCNGAIFLTMLILCWIYGAGFFGIYMSDNTSILYNMEGFYWEYDDGNWSETVNTIEIYTTMTFLVITFIVYLIVILYIFLMRTSNSITMSSTKKYEFRLFIQSVITFLVFVIDDCCWNFHPLVFPDSYWAPVASNLIWILELGLNPLFYLFFNKTIRKQFIGILKCESPTTTRVTILMTSTHTRAFKLVSHRDPRSCY
uniref:7TM GPCR serpentine receptor class x (Srx) domain-containing protein n=2 Tax=Panagrolaimus sp. JU765 TaxID=591449 RepID=A0AC34RRF5_9BILA